LNEGRTPEVDNNTQVAVLDLATNRYKVVIRGGSDARYVPTGHLVYHDGGTLRAVGFDLQPWAGARIALSGNLQNIAEYGPHVLERLFELQRPAPLQTPDRKPVEIAAIR
jgi:hypothetical protein